MLSGMRKQIMLTGLILLIIGAGMAIISYHEVYQGTITASSFTNPSGSEWISNSLNVTNDSTISVIGNGSDFYLVKTSDLSDINQTNVQSLAIKPSANLSIAGRTDKEYFNLTGPYSVVYFGAKDPAILYEVIPSSGNVVSYGLLLISGGVLALAGIIVIIVGAILKRKI
jgi:hypothetical protein